MKIDFRNCLKHIYLFTTFPCAALIIQLSVGNLTNFTLALFHQLAVVTIEEQCQEALSATRSVEIASASVLSLDAAVTSVW